MKEIIVKTQQEFDALPSVFEEHTRIVIQNNPSDGRIQIKKSCGNSSVVAWGNSSVAALGNSSVEAWDNSSVVAWGNSSVVAWDNSSVVARGNSSVEASGNSSVVAWGNSSVEARGNSSVVAWGNSSVVASGNSSVVAWDNVGVHLQSDSASVVLFMFAVCWILQKGRVEKKSETATIIDPKPVIGTDGWLNSQGIAAKDDHAVLYKKVSANFQTQEETTQETCWKVGKTVEHPNWSPEESECGEGKFHACSRPYFCDEFRNKTGDRYIAVRVPIKDLYVWSNGSYPHKVAFRTGTVLYECNKFGKKIG